MLETCIPKDDACVQIVKNFKRNEASSQADAMMAYDLCQRNCCAAQCWNARWAHTHPLKINYRKRLLQTLFRKTSNDWTGQNLTSLTKVSRYRSVALSILSMSISISSGSSPFCTKLLSQCHAKGMTRGCGMWKTDSWIWHDTWQTDLWNFVHRYSIACLWHAHSIRKEKIGPKMSWIFKACAWT
jgi:hypothetical protein